MKIGQTDIGEESFLLWVRREKQKKCDRGNSRERRHQTKSYWLTTTLVLNGQFVNYTVWHRFTVDEAYDNDAIGSLSEICGLKDDWALVLHDVEIRFSPKSFKNIIYMADRHHWPMLHVHLRTNVSTLPQPRLIPPAARPVSKKYKKPIEKGSADLWLRAKSILQ